jgi:uncharacterized membrane protein
VDHPLLLVLWLSSSEAQGRGESSLKTNINKLGGLYAIDLSIFICSLSVVGPIFAASWHNNFLLLLLVVLIAAIVLCSCSTQLVPSWTYPFLIVAIAFSLLFHVSLISPYLVGFDVHGEYYFARLTALNSGWERMLPETYNGMLSVTILPVMYSILIGIGLDWVFKIIYPLIFALVPLVLYLAYRKLTGSRIAFLSAFLLMCYITFYFEMLGNARQMIAELFLALSIFVVSERKISLGRRRFLFVVFGVGMMVSHYSVSYIFLFCIAFALCAVRLFKGSQMKGRGVISIEVVLLLLGIVFAWYIFVSPIQIEAVTKVSSHILAQVVGFIIPPGVEGLLPPFVSPIHEASKYLFLVVQLFVPVGLLAAILKNRRRFGNEYLALSVACMLILAACLGIPSFAASIVMSRFHHVTMFFLAPFGVLGAIITLRSIGRGIMSLRGIGSSSTLGQSSTTITTILFVSLLLFQVGFVYEVAGDVPISISLGIARKDLWPGYMHAAYTFEQDVISAEWLYENAPHASKVYGDQSIYHVLTSYGMISNERLRDLYSTQISNEGAYIYLRSYNTLYGRLLVIGGLSNTSQLAPLLDEANAVYSNGQSPIYSLP